MAHTTKAGIKAGVTALALTLAALSTAQTNGRTGFSARIGAFFPNSGSSNINVGVDYKLRSVRVDPNLRGREPAYFGLSLDYYGDANSYAVPLVFTYNVRASTNFVAFAGVGADVAKGNGNDSRFGFAAQIGASYEFATEGQERNPIFVQAKYFYSQDNANRGFAVTLGYRF